MRHPGNGGNGGNGANVFTGYEIKSSSTSANSTVELKVILASLPQELVVGSSVELYLEDDYQVPASIASNTVYFIATGGSTADVRRSTGDGSPVLATSPVLIGTDDHYGGDDDYALQVTIPDMCPGTTSASGGHGPCDGQNGLKAGQTLTLVFTRSAGIQNPSEEKNYKVGAQVLPLGIDTQPNSGPDADSAATLPVKAKVSLSDDDNKRGYELTVTGSGFNNGTTANAYVLQVLPAETPPADCAALVDDPKATNIGSALVGSNDIATVIVEVTVPTFGRGNVNYICMVDGENRPSSETAAADNFDRFKLEPSIRVVPGTASSGDIVNLFAQDYPFNGQSLTSLKLAGQEVIDAVAQLRRQGLANGSATISFEVPGSVNDEPLQGTVRVDARWGNLNADGKCTVAGNCTSKDTKITITGSELTASMTDVLPNETITLTGNGFGSQTCIDVADITLDQVALEVDDESTIRCGSGDDVYTGVEVSNSGQFVATITLWPDDNNDDNPTLISGSHTLSVEDSGGFVGETTLTIAAPTISVVPEVAGPRDYIVITGMNWPVDNVDNSNAGLVEVEIDDDKNVRKYSVYTDNTGRFSIEHRVSKDVAIPSTNRVTGTYSDVVKVGSFAVPAATVTVTPSEAQPGDMIDLSATDMPVYATADYVKIGGTVFDDPGANTDIDGNISIADVLVPGLDPGTYSVIINVDGTVAIGSIDVLAEDSARGAAAELPGALEELGDSLVRVFHFNGVNKSWDFYDPRADFADLNTLTKMVNGEPYWILVSEGQEDVVLNNKSRSLTCLGGDCWNQIVW